MLWLWIPGLLVLILSTSAVGQESCVFAGHALPCTIETNVNATQPITLAPIGKADWEFLERDMARDATALHAELLNNTTLENAKRYAMSEIYRQYRGMQAMKLATYVRMQIMNQMRAKYGDLDELGLIEAAVIESGMPVINVPDLSKTLKPGDLMDARLSSMGEPYGK